MNAIKFSILIFFFSANFCLAQKASDMRSYNNVTFYLVDNSDGFEADAMNDDMVQQLKENLIKLSSRPDNYFFFYGCNGEEQLISDNITNFVDLPSFKKYLRNPSKESDFSFDKQAIREHFAEYPIKAKQNIEINIYLSTYGVKRTIKEVESLPTAILFANEFPLFLNPTNIHELSVKLNICINKEAKSLSGFDEEKIKSYFTFCTDELKIQKTRTEISFL